MTLQPKSSETAGLMPRYIDMPATRATVGGAFTMARWALSASGLAPGRYALTAYFWSTRTGRFEDARTVSVTVR